jgi:transposase
MTATHVRNSTAYPSPVLYLAFELGSKTWKLAFTVGFGQKPRIRTIPAGNLKRLDEEILAAKKRFGLSENIQVISCYEAGRDGFWLDHYLVDLGIRNVVVDSSSIEVNRRKRRAKSDRLDASKLVTMLVRWNLGEHKLWSIVAVPSVEEEDSRQLHRELIQLKTERTSHTNRIKGLLAGLGMSIVVNAHLPERLEALRQWDDRPVPAALRRRILREFDRWKLVSEQIRDIDKQRLEEVRLGDQADLEKVRKLMKLKGVGINSAWILVREFFGWRDIRNRRHLASLAGLAPTPYDSGDSRREQGISKAGNKRVRWVMTEIAWGWLQFQPNSKLSRWYRRRFGPEYSRSRKIGIVALARKLLIAFWKYLEKGEVPEGAVEVDLKTKIGKPKCEEVPTRMEVDPKTKIGKPKCEEVPTKMEVDPKTKIGKPRCEEVPTSVEVDKPKTKTKTKVKRRPRQESKAS